MACCSEQLRLDLATPVYISKDIGALDPAYTLGVLHREPGGLLPRQVIDLILAIDRPIVAADIVEYNPRCDTSDVTATVAAKAAEADRGDDGEHEKDVN